MFVTRRGTRVLAAICVLIAAFLLAPILVVVAAAVNDAPLLRFPPVGFSLRWFAEFFASAPFVEALWTSVWLAAGAAAGAVLLGTAAAFACARAAVPGAAGVRMLVLAPLQLPHILTAIAVLVLAHQIGWGGGAVLLVATHTMIVLPYVFLTVSASVADFDLDVEHAARSLGARPARAFAEVTLPLTAAAIASGGLMAFLMSFDEFPTSLLLAGIGTTTLPVQMYDYLRFETDPVPAAASVITIALAAAGMWLMSRLVGLGRIGR